MHVVLFNLNFGMFISKATYKASEIKRQQALDSEEVFNVPIVLQLKHKRLDHHIELSFRNLLKKKSK